MKNVNNYKVLYVLSGLSLLTFIIKIIIDWCNYDSLVESAPFYVYILLRSLEFLLPCLLFFIAGKLMKKGK